MKISAVELCQHKINSNNKKSFKQSNLVQNQDSKIKTNLNDSQKNHLALIGSCLGVVTLAYVTNNIITKKSLKTQEINKIKQITEEMLKFPQDVDYRKSILKDIGHKEDEFYKLRSIIGIQEFKEAIKKLSSDKEHFMPGIKTHASNNEALFDGLENVKSGKFAANLHLHTHYSDGRISVPELLEQSVKYANQRVELLGPENPFYLAITDHNTAKGCKEATKIILENPEKFKNLRLILGIEHTGMVFYENIVKAPVETHMISYGINPFDKTLDDFLTKPVTQNRQTIQNVLNNANEKYQNLLKKYSVQFSLEDMTKLFPVIDASPLTANYWTKDYMQFRLIYDATVKNNQPLQEFLKLNNIDIDFTKPLSRIDKNPDYSQGQKYYEYYYKAIKTYIKEFLTLENSTKADKLIKNIPEDLYTILNELEWKTNDSNSRLFVKKVTYPQLESIIKFMKDPEYGALGLAHPGIMFPVSNISGNKETLKFYENLYRDFTTLGGEKAVFAEDNYAVYYNTNIQEILPKLAEISSKYGLLKTGGLDTHVRDIFKSKM